MIGWMNGCWVNGCRPFGSIRPLHGNLDHWWWQYIRGGADNFLARPGRKQATATKLGIYSKYSQRSSIHLLVHCSKFCPPLKKKTWKLSVQPGLRDSNDLRDWRKNGDLSIVFSVQRTGGSGLSRHWKPRKANFFWVAGARWAGALSCKNKTPLVTFPRRFFYKMSFNFTSRDE
jgi:hypothetical protein